MNDAKEEAVRAIIEFVKSPDMFQVSHYRFGFCYQLHNDELKMYL